MFISGVVPDSVAAHSRQVRVGDRILTINGSQIKIGAFLTVAVSVLLTGIGVFLLIVKPYNRLKKQVPEVPKGPTQEELLTEIRDLLARR